MSNNAPYNIYQAEMIRLCHGFPVWQASPRHDRPPVAVGDFGFMLKGRFVQIFNAIDPGSMLIPDDFESLQLSAQDAPYTSSCEWPNPMCTSALKSVGVSLKLDSAFVPVSGNADIKVTGKSGAALALRSTTTRKDTDNLGTFKNHLLRFHKSVHTFAVQKRGYELDLSDLIFVTGCDLAGDHAMLAFRETRAVDLSIGLNGPGIPSVGAELSFSWRVDPFVHTNRGPSQVQHLQNSPSTLLYDAPQSTLEGNDVSDPKCCLFIRGWRIKTRPYKRATRLRGGAATPPNRLSPESDEEWCDYSSGSVELEDISETLPYEDPVNKLFDYIFSTCADATLAMVHDHHLVKIMQLADPSNEGIGMTEMLMQLRPRVILGEHGAANIDIGALELFERKASNIPLQYSGNLKREEDDELGTNEAYDAGPMIARSAIGPPALKHSKGKASDASLPYFGIKSEWNDDLGTKEAFDTASIDGRSAAGSPSISREEIIRILGECAKSGTSQHSVTTLKDCLCVEGDKSIPNSLLNRHVVAQLRDFCERIPPVGSLASAVQFQEYHTWIISLTSELGLMKHEGLTRALSADERAIARHVLQLISSEHWETDILSLRGKDAELFLNLLQQGVDGVGPFAHEIDGLDQCKKRLSSLILQISIASDILPRSLFLKRVQVDRFQPAIGMGRHSDVFSGIYDGTAVALKRLRVKYNATGYQRLCREVLPWRQLNHPRILPFLGVDGDSFIPAICMVSPYMSNGNVIDYLNGRFSYTDVVELVRLAAEIADGVEYLHNEGIVHGDLRAVNVLIDHNNHVQICDFGSTSFYDVDTSHGSEKEGNPRWMAPELLSSDDEYPRRTYASDIFSFGRVYLELFTRSPPFASVRSDASVTLQVTTGSLPSRPNDAECHGGRMPDDVWQLIGLCWKTNADDRPAAGAVKEMTGAALLRRRDAWFEMIVSDNYLQSGDLDRVGVSKQYYNQLERGESQLAHQGILKSVRVLNGEVERDGGLPVGGGVYSDIWLGWWQGLRVALKSLRMVKFTKKIEDRFVQEINVWSRLKHSNILPFYGVVTNIGQHVNMVSPWQEEGNVLKYVESHPGCSRLSLMLGASRGLAYLHFMKVVHGNMKCTNILCSPQGNPLICDFGLSKVIEDVTETMASATLTTSGSARWLAPELIEGTITSPNTQSDTWSFGMTMLECVTRKHPYAHIRRDTMVIHEIVSEKRHPPRPAPEVGEVSDGWWDIIKSCWADAGERPSMHQVVDQLKKLMVPDMSIDLK